MNEYLIVQLNTRTLCFVFGKGGGERGGDGECLDGISRLISGYIQKPIAQSFQSLRTQGEFVFYTLAEAVILTIKKKLASRKELFRFYLNLRNIILFFHKSMEYMA